MHLLSFLSAAAIVLSLVLVQVLEGQALSHNRSRVLPALLAFGDSLVDPGNNNLLPTVAKSNFPPYGRDFAGHKATGRFTNGKIATDILGTVDLGHSCMSNHHHEKYHIISLPFIIHVDMKHMKWG